MNIHKKNPFNGNQPSSLVILLHGYGSSGDDLIGLADMWAEHLPETVFIAPDAPSICEDTPLGFQWFGIRDWSMQTLLKGAEGAHPGLDKFIREMQEEFDIPPEKTALVGFSQGTMMSLYAGLRQNRTIAGILGYSGALLGDEPDENADRPPICLVHGDSDMVVPISYYDQTMTWLQKYDYDVEGHKIRGLGHSIDQEGLRLGAEFLRKTLY